MTILKIWVLTFALAMPDGRHIVTHKSYPDEATCLAAGEMSKARYAAVQLPAGYKCTSTQTNQN